MSAWEIAWVVVGAATVYPYYRFAIKPRTPAQRRQGRKETSWRDLDPVFFPLITVLCWPICLFTIAIALYVQRLDRHDQAGDGLPGALGADGRTLLERLTEPLEGTAE